MNELRWQILSGLSGMMLGWIYSGWIWWKIKQHVYWNWSETGYVITKLIMTGIVLLGFCLLGILYWEGLPLCLVGFLTVRHLLTWWREMWGNQMIRKIQNAVRAH